MDLYKKLCEIAGADNVLKDEPMKKHTTFRIGRSGRLFYLPDGYRRNSRDCISVQGKLHSVLYYGKRKQSSRRR